MGKFLAYALPIRTYRIPLPKPFSPITFSLNPGPWNIKEHGLIFIMANAAISSPYALYAIGTLRFFYGLHYGFWSDALFVLSTQIIGFGLAGMCRSLFVWPASMIWPRALVSCTLFNTMHAEVDEGKGQLTRWKMFSIIAVSSFFFFFFPGTSIFLNSVCYPPLSFAGYLFQALSLFSFICWIVPDNVVVNQLFGSASGLGMNILTFDWTEISWIMSPLVTPWWAQLHIFGGFVLFYWILLPILYYTNVSCPVSSIDFVYLLF
jgi:OPT family oligopeptide transporter